MYKAKHRKQRKVYFEMSSVRRYTAGREAKCSKRTFQSIPSCEPESSTHASTRRGMEEMSRWSQCHRCVRPREQEACMNTSESWRGTCFEHHWPNELLTPGRSAAPGLVCWWVPYFMGFSWGFHGVGHGRPKCYVFIYKMSLLGARRGPQGHRPV